MIEEPAAPQPAPPPRRPGETARERRERRAGIIRLTLGGVLTVAIILAVGFGDAGWYWLLALPLVAFDMVGAALLRREAMLRTRFMEPGHHRVVLQVTGDRPIHVIRELRRITGQDLVSAKRIVEAAPIVVLEGVTQESAAQAAHLLQVAGARAVATPLDDAR